MTQRKKIVCEVCGKSFPEDLTMHPSFDWCFECDDKYMIVDGRLREIGKGFVDFEQNKAKETSL